MIGTSLTGIDHMTVLPESHKTPARRDASLALSDEERARRRGLFVEARFTAIVRGVDVSGRRFECDAVLEQLSACCLGIRMRRPVHPGAGLFVLIRLGSTPSRSAARVAVHGRVVGMRKDADGLCAVTAEYAHHRFLYACEA